MGPGFMYGYGNFGTFGWIGLIINAVLTIAVIIGIVLLVVWAVRRITSNGHSATMSGPSPMVQSTPREILQNRYARGEISREEYQQMLKDLG